MGSISGSNVGYTASQWQSGQQRTSTQAQQLQQDLAESGISNTSGQQLENQLMQAAYQNWSMISPTQAPSSQINQTNMLQTLDVALLQLGNQLIQDLKGITSAIPGSFNSNSNTSSLNTGGPQQIINNILSNDGATASQISAFDNVSQQNANPFNNSNGYYNQYSYPGGNPSGQSYNGNSFIFQDFKRNLSNLLTSDGMSASQVSTLFGQLSSPNSTSSGTSSTLSSSSNNFLTQAGLSSSDISTLMDDLASQASTSTTSTSSTSAADIATLLDSL